ncbi:MAG: rod shape-determining protein RodA [Candidatus Colwellbacteria bacterium]|nr:rod shape-determining protein RodA [Candidatus Colwellbacteria bacterium]
MGGIVSNKLDLKLLFSAGALILMSFLVLASSGGELVIKQLIWLIPATFFLIGLPLLNVKALVSYRWVFSSFYFVSLALLVVTYFVAPVIGGARSWITLGAFQIQPSEFMKAALIILLSSFFAVRHVAIGSLRVILASFVYALIPFALILLQPDLGTALVIFGVWFGFLLVSGIRRKHLLIALLVLVVIGFLGWNFVLEGYQKARIQALFSPEVDPLGINYSTIQSKIAIGSGGIWGKGFGQGTQAHLGFLPAAHTDFIFSSFVEEWGLFGGVLLLIAFGSLVYRTLVLGMESGNNFGRFLALGTALMLLIHFVINIGSAIGMLPVIGVGLPLVSYGGSNLLTTTLLLGIIQGVSDRKVRE